MWSRLIQDGLDNQQEIFNSHKTRWDPKKYNPSGVSPNVAFTLWEDYGGAKNCPLPIPEDELELVAQLMEDLGNEELLCFVPRPFAKQCEEAFDSLELQVLDFTNVWMVFEALLPLVFENPA